MRKLTEGPWWRLPAVIIGAGIVIIALAILVKLGWIVYIVGLVVLAVGIAVLQHGERDGSRSVERGVAVAFVVVLAGAWVLHPQGWHSPGWTMPGTSDTVIGRDGSVVVMENNDMFSGRTLSNGNVVWRHHWQGTGVVTHGDLLVQVVQHPQKAHAYKISNGKSLGLKPWPGAVAQTSTASQTQTASSGRALPAIHSGDKVLATVTDGNEAAQLVATSDLTGHKYTRLDTVAGTAESSYRLKDADKLVLSDGVLLVEGKNARVIDLQG